MTSAICWDFKPLPLSGWLWSAPKYDIEYNFFDWDLPVTSALPIVNLFTISIDFNQFQSISITFNPKFKWGLGLDRKSHILGEIGIWDCHNRNPSLLPRDDSAPFMYREIHKKVLCQNSQMLDLSYHISSENTFSFSCLPQWARKYRKSSYSAVFFSKEGSRLDCRSHF